MNNNPIYLNWEFWTVIVAATALVLSQIPPIYQLVRRAKLTMEIYPRIAIGHRVGYPTVQLGIVISNAGGREVRVKKITIEILRDGTPVAILPTQLYSPESEPTKLLLFTGFKIKPSEDRMHNYQFSVDLTRNQERELGDKALALTNDIAIKQANTVNKDALIEADSANVQPLLEMLSKNFIWNEGEYGMNIKVASSDPKVFVEKAYHFWLYESDSRQLRNFGEKYKYGEGIYYGLEKQWLWTRIAEA